MAEPTKTNFGELERQIMNLLWRRGPMTVRQVLASLQSHRHVAYTTVMTVMNRLVDQACLNRQPLANGAFRYQPTSSREQVAAAATKRSLASLVQQYGDVALVQFLDQLDQIPSHKLQQLRQQRRRSSRHD